MGEEALSRSLCKSVYMPGSSLTVQVVTSCKSHKPPGPVKFRNTHSAPCHSFAGFAIWSAKQYRIHTPSFKNLHKDTCHFIQQISELKALPECMSGEPEVLAVGAAGLSNKDQEKRLIYDVDRFLREYQLVTTERHPDRLWRVKRGSSI